MAREFRLLTSSLLLAIDDTLPSKRLSLSTTSPEHTSSFYSAAKSLRKGSKQIAVPTNFVPRLAPTSKSSPVAGILASLPKSKVTAPPIFTPSISSRRAILLKRKSDAMELEQEAAVAVPGVPRTRKPMASSHKPVPKKRKSSLPSPPQNIPRVPSPLAAPPANCLTEFLRCLPPLPATKAQPPGKSSPYTNHPPNSSVFNSSPPYTLPAALETPVTTTDPCDLPVVVTAHTLPRLIFASKQHSEGPHGTLNGFGKALDSSSGQQILPALELPPAEATPSVFAIDPSLFAIDPSHE